MKFKSIKKIWYRNSILFNYWKFPFSDIDITIYTFDLNLFEKEKIAKTHTHLKKIFPIIGEVVFYQDNESFISTRYANPIELSRDVFLDSVITKKAHDLTDEIIFIVKFINANIDRILNNKVRDLKFIYYFNCLNFKHDNRLSQKQNILNLFKEKYNIALSDHFFLNIYEITVLKNYEKIHKLSNLEFALIFNYCHFQHKNRQFTDFEKQLIFKNTQWEIWGIYSYMCFNNKDIQYHISSLQQSCKEILIENQNEFLKNGFEAILYQSKLKQRDK